MKERPILFNTAMVKAILEGRKTQTRRVINEKTLKSLDLGNQLGECYELDHPKSKECGYILSFCPHGQVGDRLWVRETFCMGRIEEDDNPFTWPKDLYVDNYEGEDAYPIYKEMVESEKISSEDVCWTPSIHMPRSASRILLEITKIRIERLNDISSDDAKAEGFDYSTHPSAIEIGYAIGAKTNFRFTWEQIYGQNAWNKNPWVWCITFKVIDGGAA
ncbi:hypothetical protein [Acinetobacter ursingii]|uniref:hypothetical protein n=1 Tax=Acinetobacter ursingii TaxID=108980 RepID=UPI00124D562E|nr:hypothetical protein [Acinetobacter ursingii]